MFYSFPTGELKKDYYNLKTENVTLEVVGGKKHTDIANNFLNGTYQIKGILDNDCIKDHSKILPGSIWKLTVGYENRYSTVDVIFIDILDIVNSPYPRLRRYSWLFGVIKKPTKDQIGFMPQNDGEITLDELLEEIGSNRAEMSTSKKKFTSEGGFF